MLTLGLLSLAAIGVPSVTVGNGHVSATFDPQTGKVAISWPDGTRIRGAYGGVELRGQLRKTTDFSAHEISQQGVQDRLGRGVCVTFRHHDKSGPTVRQTFWLYDQQPELFVQLTLESSSLESTNRVLALASDTALGGSTSLLTNSLFVPYDNDSYFRYRSDAWKEGGSYEVGAVYDDVSRTGLLIGSIDHDTWKSAIQFGTNGSFAAVAGSTGTYTHDTQPHGAVTGKRVLSPRYVVGKYADWRKGLERFGDLNARVKPPLPWNGKVPFGWSSWSGHKDKVTANDADAAVDFIRDELPHLRTGGTAYINLDSFWDNLTKEQRQAFVRKAHASGLKAGIYWTPFVNWGEPTWKAIDAYTYGDMQLKDSAGNYLPKLSGGWPLDPTHPGTLARIDKTLAEFEADGYDFIKLDFVTHGALEGKHFDPKVQTGTQAYRVGMQHIVDRLKRSKMFVCLSIAPMFPHGYGHSRRISCDVFSNIGASEYFLNSQNYGWWTAGRLYAFNDPDSACVYQAKGESPTTEAEGRTRFVASVIGGGIMIEGDDLTNPEAKARVRQIFGNRELVALAAKTPRFRPIRGDTADKAGDMFVSTDGRYVALFNFTQDRKAVRLAPARFGGHVGQPVRDMVSGKVGRTGEYLEWELGPTDCALLQVGP